MIIIKGKNARKLPAPLATILLYAADGMSARNNHLSRVGRPRTPERAVWVPYFRQLLETPEGIRMLQGLVEAGMRGWDCPPVYFDCLKAAFRELGFRARAISVLEGLAESARERVTMPEPPRRPPAADTRPRRERKKPGSSGPSQPGRRPRGSRHGPG